MTTWRGNLIPHPADTGPLVALEVSGVVARTPGGASIAFEVRGPAADIAWPAAVAPVRADGLWRHTCFECFLARPGHNAYYEWNASPSGAWAVYRFGGYRERLADPEGVTPPALVVRHGKDALRAELVLDLAGIGRLGRFDALECALAAVFEDASGGRVHFALAHPAERADFHDRRGFALTLAPTAHGAAST
jgi:hypothetical protein